MATFKYFRGEVELVQITNMDRARFAALFPGVKGLRCDGYSFWVGRTTTGELQPVERRIEMRAFPSLHTCDARCLNAQGKIMRCECSCEGRNHGRGAFTSLIG